MKTISKVIHDPLDLIGNTPMMQLRNIDKTGNDIQIGNIWVKIEYLNPSGSLKDRMALQMIEDAEKSGQLKPTDTIVEASSGNTALALAFVGGVKGYKRQFFCPEGISQEKIDQLTRYGADVQIMRSEDNFLGTAMHGAFAEIPGRMKCKELEDKEDHIWWAKQFSNPSNYSSYEKLAEEMIDQVDGVIDGVVASVGTGGTICGIAKTLKRYNPKIKVWTVEPENAHFMTLTNFEVIPGITGGIFTEIQKNNLIDKFIKIGDQPAIEMHYRLIREEGLFAGVSSGANVLAAIALSKELGEGSNVVTVLPDNANRYLSSVHYTT